MLRLRGSQALSDFRIHKLLKTAQEQFPSVSNINPEYQHLVKLHDDAADLSTEELNKLNKLLNYGPAMSEVAHQGLRLYVLPRFGTISPWSTKATDIVAHCGLSKIKRVERGIAYYISSSTDLSEADVSQLQLLLHDPMTESVAANLEQAEQLFRDEFHSL